MAPSRRKGANRTAAVAAARRKWKVGDLVLAKVKGFPAWPATVSEPGKWGYPADQKKIVVQFFGGEQIAFCNPVDIEEFTEEKKVSLLGKRHGKGADFVRAVNEIIEHFEKLKKQEQVSGANGTEETDIINENSQESVVASRKDEAPLVKVDPLSAGTTNDLDSLTEAAVAAATDDAFENEDMQNLVFTDIPVSTPYLTRHRMDVSRSQNSGSTKKKPARRLRSSSRIDSRLRSTSLPSVNKNRNARRFCVSALEDRSVKRSRRIVKSSDESDGKNVDSLAFVANDCIEENNSGLISLNSDTLSIDDGSTVDSVSKPLGVREPAAENNEGETELSDRLDFQSNNVVKKKRKPNRKRHNTHTVDTATLNRVASDAEELKIALVSPSFGEKPAQKQAKDDGDEHLPLVKRARVRMGIQSPSAEKEFPSVNKEEHMPEVPERHCVQSFESLSCKVNGHAKVKDHANKESVPVKDEPSLSSVSHVSPASRQSFWETRKDFLDGEAALPPSKRLHRALEAMSANVAEGCQRNSKYSVAADIQSNGYCDTMECYEMAEVKKDMIELGSGGMDDTRNCDSLLSAPESCIASDVGGSGIGAEITEVVSDCGKANITDSQNPIFCPGASGQVEVCDDIKVPKKILFVEVPAEINPVVEDRLKMETENAGEQANLNCNAPSAVLSPTDHWTTRLSELKEAVKGSDADIVQIQTDSTSMQDIAVSLPSIGTCNRPDDKGGVAQKTEDLASVEHNPDSKMSERVEEARPSLNSNVVHPVTPVKVLNSGHGQSLVHSTSVSYEHIEDRTVSATQSSSSPTDGPESVARTSPPSFPVCNTSALDNKRSLVNNSSSYADVHLHLEKAKLAGKSISKSEVLSSFEAIIKSLTRTKESIGRATRIAIDCAKFGFATKVVEILAHNLEIESSLPRKVDLFFLVDSITQCSRGIKGDGGVYPSAIQALLPRLLLAAAPPGSSSHENHRQCLKVLKVWQERKILPEPIIRHHIRELDALCGSFPTIGSNRTLRNERAFDDPVREMDGMLVDEYGSNSSIQLPGFCMPRMVGVDCARNDSDDESFEAVTPEHNVDNHEVEKNLIPAAEKHRHILEDVDGELEMEDVAPCCEDEIVSTSSIGGLDQAQMSHHQPKNVPLASVPVSRSPLPPPPPPHPLPPSAFPPVLPNSVTNRPDSKPYSSSQKYNGNLRDPMNVDAVHHCVRGNKDYEAEVPRHMPDNGCFSDRPTSRFSGRASGCDRPNDGFGKSFYLRPPHPAPSNQFSYVQEQQRGQSRKDAPLPSRQNRFHSRNTDNGNFYRDRDRNKFVQRDNIGEGWRPPYPSTISGPCYPDGSRMVNAPMSYDPPREPPGPHHRWNYPSRPMNHRHYNPYRPPSEGPIPVANRGPNYWRPR